MFQFNHFNFNVLNLEKSLEFYKEALGLDVVREKDASDGSFKIVYLGDGSSDFLLELTWMRDQKEPYNLGAKLLILDEPTTGVDARSTKILYDMLYEINTKYNTTIFMITHGRLQECKGCDRILRMDEGRIVEE